MVSVFMTHFTEEVTETKHAERINVEHITSMEHYSILHAQLMRILVKKVVML